MNWTAGWQSNRFHPDSWPKRSRHKANTPKTHCGCSLLCVLQVLQLASHLRRAGYFVLAALTLPFDFEGRRKVEEASALVEALQDVANLVVRSAAAKKSCYTALATCNWLDVHAWCSNGSAPCTAMHPFFRTTPSCAKTCAEVCLVAVGSGASGCAGARLSRADSHASA